MTRRLVEPYFRLWSKDMRNMKTTAIVLLSVVTLVSSSYPPPSASQQMSAPAQAANAQQYAQSSGQSKTAQQPQGYQPPVRAPVINVYQPQQAPPAAQQYGPQNANVQSPSAQQAASPNGGNLQEILYILPIIQSLDRMTDNQRPQQATYGAQNQVPPQPSGYASPGHQAPQSYGGATSTAGSQSAGYQSQAPSGAGYNNNNNAQASYGSGTPAASGQAASHGSMLSMVVSQAASGTSYGANSAPSLQAAPHVQLPQSYGNSPAPASGYDVAVVSSGGQISGSGYASPPQQQQPAANPGSSYGSSRLVAAGAQVMAAGYGVQLPSAPATEVGVALKPVLSQQSQYPTVSYSQLNNQPKVQQSDTYQVQQGGYQSGSPVAGAYDSGPSAYELCEQNYNLDGFCKGKYAGLYSHPNPQCFIQCDQFETHTTSLCAPGTVWLTSGYEPSSVNQCVHSANSISGSH